MDEYSEKFHDSKNAQILRNIIQRNKDFFDESGLVHKDYILKNLNVGNEHREYTSSEHYSQDIDTVMLEVSKRYQQYSDWG